MKTYTVAYTMGFGMTEEHVSILAANKIDAYDRAAYEVIPEREEAHPYAVWVYSVTYANGHEQRFNTFEGKRF